MNTASRFSIDVSPLGLPPCHNTPQPGEPQLRLPAGLPSTQDHPEVGSEPVWYAPMDMNPGPPLACKVMSLNTMLLSPCSRDELDATVCRVTSKLTSAPFDLQPDVLLATSQDVSDDCGGMLSNVILKQE